MINIMSCAKQISTKCNDLNNMVYKRTIDVKMSIAKKDDPQNPIKSVNIHQDCTVPLLKLLLIILGVFFGLSMFIMCLRKWLS